MSKKKKKNKKKNQNFIQSTSLDTNNVVGQTMADFSQSNIKTSTTSELPSTELTLNYSIKKELIKILVIIIVLVIILTGAIIIRQQTSWLSGAADWVYGTMRLGE